LLNHKEFKIGNLENEYDLSKLRWTLDQKEDYKFLCEIIRRVKKRPILMNDVLTVLSCEPQLSKINSHIDPDEGLKKSKKDDEEFSKEPRLKNNV